MRYGAHNKPILQTNKIDVHELRSIVFRIKYETDTLPISFNNIFTQNSDSQPFTHTRQSPSVNTES